MFSFIILIVEKLLLMHVLCQMCKDYDAGLLYASWKDMKMWRRYAEEHGVDHDCNLRNGRATMTINRLKFFYGLYLGDYKKLT